MCNDGIVFLKTIQLSYMKTFILTLFTFFTFTLSSHLLAQNVAINATGSNADASAMLDVSSTTSGFLLPRLTTAQQNSITLPAKGLTIFNTSLNSIMLNIGTPLSPNWSSLAAGAIDTSSIANFSIKVRSLTTASAPITFTNGQIGITQSGTSTNGYLSSTDWNTFNNKANTADVWKVLGNSGTNSGINFIGTIDNKSFRFRTNNVERMIIDSLGNVGIGTSSFDPSQPEKLLVDAGSHPNNGPVVNSTPINAVGASNGFQQVQVQNKSWGNYSSSDFVAASDGTQNGTAPVNTDLHYVDLGINSSGYTNSNSNILNQQYTPYLYSTAPQDFYIGNGYSGRSLIFFTNSGPTNANNTADGFERMRIASNGNIGIGTNSTGTYKVNVAGTMNASGGYTQASDIRLKKNINNLNYGLNEVLSLRPVRYNWKDSSHLENKIGFIAQEVRKLVPEVVQGDESKETIGMNYSELVPVLVNAIKEQQQQIDDLKKDIQLLRSKK